MAKIRLSDYLKKKRKKEEVLFESDEDILRRARNRMDADAFIVSPAYRIENYRQTEKLVMQIPDYAEADTIRKQSRSGIEQAEREKKARDLALAHRHYEEAETEDEFRKAQKEFAALGEYGDARESGERAEEMAQALRKKANRRGRLRLAAVLILAAAVFLCFQTGLLGYAAAKLEGMSGVYVSARNRFLKLGDFLDAPEQAEYYNQKYLRQRELEEKSSLSEAEAGDSVDFGEFTWTVLEREDTQLLLILKTIEADGIFGPRAYDEDGDGTSWSESSLRAYLNEEAIGAFAEAERAAMLPMTHMPSDNEAYGTDGGPEAEDRIRIPDMEEVTRYMEEERFTAPGADVWLCTPGHTEGTASFLTKSGKLMEYGDDVRDDSLSVFAMICVDYSRLGL